MPPNYCFFETVALAWVSVFHSYLPFGGRMRQDQHSITVQRSVARSDGTELDGKPIHSPGIQSQIRDVRFMVLVYMFIFSECRPNICQHDAKMKTLVASYEVGRARKIVVNLRDLGLIIYEQIILWKKMPTSNGRPLFYREVDIWSVMSDGEGDLPIGPQTVSGGLEIYVNSTLHSVVLKINTCILKLLKTTKHLIIC